MPQTSEEQTAMSGIKTLDGGASYIPSSQRPDGSTRKEIRIRPGYRPPEDVATYKNRSAEAWKNRGLGRVPGAETRAATNAVVEQKGKNAKRREAARRKVPEIDPADSQLAGAMNEHTIADHEKLKENWRDPSKLMSNETAAETAESERQKKVRNQLKKLKGIRELKDKKATGEKLSPDQLMKIGKESELLRDLRKLGYDGPELNHSVDKDGTVDNEGG